MWARSRSSRCTSGPTSTTGSPSSSAASTTAQPVASLAYRVRLTVTVPSNSTCIGAGDVSRRGGDRGTVVTKMAQNAPPTEKLDRATIVIASVVVVGAIMSILDTTIVNVAL